MSNEAPARDSSENPEEDDWEKVSKNVRFRVQSYLVCRCRRTLKARPQTFWKRVSLASLASSRRTYRVQRSRLLVKKSRCQLKGLWPGQGYGLCKGIKRLRWSAQILPKRQPTVVTSGMMMNGMQTDRETRRIANYGKLRKYRYNR